MNLIIHLSQAFGFRKENFLPKETLNQWEELAKELECSDPWIKVMKYKISAFFAFWMDQTVPKTPFKRRDLPQVLIGGSWGRWFRLFRLNACDICYMEFMDSLSKIKKGCPRASKKGLFEAAHETFVKITTKKEDPAKGIELIKQYDIEITRENIQHQLVRTVEEVFRGKRIGIDDLFRLPFPSTSANYYSSRSSCGAVGSIFEESSSVPVPVKKCFDYANIDRWDEELGEFVPGLAAKAANEEFNRLSEIAGYREFFERAVVEEPLVEAVALPEALKVRVITKGPPLMGYVLKPFQTYVHGILRRHPCFSLVGEPVTEELLAQRVKSLKIGEKLVSGDYKDATDGMMSWVSETLANALIDVVFKDYEDREFVEKFRQLYVRSLVGHRVKEPRRDGLENIVDQKNGQLMGSISSFPILCLANATLCRMAMEAGESRTLNLRTARLVINGDDCLFPASDVAHSVWLTLCPWFGMLPSVGKYYYSDYFCNINSTTFLYRWGRRVLSKIPDTLLWKKELRPFLKIDFVNYGILLNVKRSGGPMGTESVFSEASTFASNSREIVETFPKRLIGECYRIFLKNFRNFTKKIGLTLPWFVPQHYGGVGLIPYGHHRPSGYDNAICRILHEKKMSFPSLGKDTTWKIHSRIMQDLSLCDRDEGVGFDDQYGTLVKNVFWTACQTRRLEDVVTLGRPKPLDVRRAEKVWRRGFPTKDDTWFDPWHFRQPDYPKVIPC
jgi:hypothetical protein